MFFEKFLIDHISSPLCKLYPFIHVIQLDLLLEIFRVTTLHLLIIHYRGKHLLYMQNENDKRILNTLQLHLLYKDIVFLLAFKHEEILFKILWHYHYSLHFSLNYLA